MLVRGILSLTLIAHAVLAAQFKVIAPGAKGGNGVQVSVGGKTVALKAPDADVPYFVGEAEATAGDKYKYILNGQAETVERTLNGESTRNDFFDRPVTYANIPKLPTVLGEGAWDRAIEPGPIFDTNYITTVFVNGNPKEMEKLIVNIVPDIFNVKLTIIDPDNVHTYQGARFQLHKPGKKHNNAKQSWKWQLPQGQRLNGRDFFKLRHMEEDPTQIREKLYADILRAMGVAANQANMVRLFINGEGMGTFNMLDDIPNYSHIIANFYGGEPQDPAKIGPLYDGASGASFRDDQDNYSAFLPAPGTKDDKTLLQTLAKTLAKVNPQNDADWEKVDKLFNTDQFMRYMVMEYLAGHWDGYWQEQTNIGAFLSKADNRVYYLGQDFDATFGVNLQEGREFYKVKWTEYPAKYKGGYVINMLLQNAKRRATFKNYLHTTVDTLFNNKTLSAHVLAYHEFILPDLKWDRSIKQRSPGINFGWQFPQVTENLWGPVSAPNHNGGGADYGLLEWINKIQTTVANTRD
ncbi:coth protein-domain-containing protein [Gongronella butleri]|nr:coth protein-domain-containing protein [Gongronella butleri]